MGIEKSILQAFSHTTKDTDDYLTVFPLEIELIDATPYSLLGIVTH